VRSRSMGVVVVALFALALSALAVCFGSPASAARPSSAASVPSQRPTSAPRRLHGAEASQFLRESGISQSLDAAAGGYVEQAKLLAGDGAAQDSHGFSVAVAGDYAVVGAPADQVGANSRQGSAYVYARSGSTWTQQQKLTASDGVANDEFGYAVAIGGDTIFVGRRFTQVGNPARTRGAVYVFTRSGTTWTQNPTPLVSGDIADSDLFGSSLAYDDGTLVVGALQKNNGTTFFRGAAYVFTGSGATFTEQAKLLSDDGGFADFFGFSVAVSGDTAIVGATGLNGGGAANGRGWAYVFTRSGTAWTQQQKLQSSDGAAGDAFGYSVAVSGDTAVVGARADVVGTGGEVGSAYIFQRNAGVWSEQQKLTAAEPTPRNDFFGNGVAIKNDTVVVGSPAHEVLPGIANHGAVYVFNRSGATWTRTQKLIHSDAAPDALGQAVAFDGSSILAGAPTKSSTRGAAYVFAFVQNGSVRLTADDGAAGDVAGYSVAVSGDTAVVGAPFDDAAGQSVNQNRGAAYVFVRSGQTWSFQAKLAASDGVFGDEFGTSVAVSGNTAIVGAPRADTGQNLDHGAAYVFTRSGTTWTQSPARLQADDATSGDLFGVSVALEGDTAAVGAFNDNLDADNFGEGSVYVFTRGGGSFAQQQKIPAPGLGGLPRFGTSVALSGESLVVGAPNDTHGNADELARGAAYVFVRAGTTWTQQARLVAGDQVGDEFGASVAVSGDTVIVGAPLNDTPAGSAAANQGAAYVFTRSGAAWTQQQKLSVADAAVGDQLGSGVAIAGNSAVVGARLDSFTNPARLNQGSAYVFARSGATWAEGAKLSAFDGAEHDQFGWSVALSGNTAVVGAPFDDVEGKADQGSAHVFTLEAVATPTPTPTPTPTQPGTVSFSSTTFEASEGEGTGGGASQSAQGSAAAVTVTRTDASQSASVDYATENGTASDRSDYVAAYGTLRFEPGETSKSFTVHITDDAFQETVETFSVVLSNPIGVSLGTPSSATINVTSNDAATGASPVKGSSFDVDFFVRQHYADFLGRAPDQSGLDFWKNSATDCGDADVLVCRINVSAAFFLSIEHQETGYLVHRAYKAAFGNLPGKPVPLTLREYLSGSRQIGDGVQVRVGNWQQKLETNKEAFFDQFVKGSRFTTLYDGLTNEQYVDALNQNAGGALTQAERDALVNALNGGTQTRARVLRVVAEDPDLAAAERNRAFVLAQYFGYLRRDPDDTDFRGVPDPNFEGYNHWLQKLNQFNGNFVEAEMVRAFIESIEYGGRFGQ